MTKNLGNKTLFLILFIGLAMAVLGFMMSAYHADKERTACEKVGGAYVEYECVQPIKGSE